MHYHYYYLINLIHFLLFVVTTLLPTTTSMKLLDGKRILVTGAGRGIGRAIALICHEEGALVAISSRTIEELEQTIHMATTKTTTTSSSSSCLAVKNNPSSSNDVVGGLGTTTTTTTAMTTIVPYVADITNETQVDNMVQEIVSQWGGLDVLINNAGGGQHMKGPVDGILYGTSSTLSSLLTLNVVGAHIVTSSVLRWAMMMSPSAESKEQTTTKRHILNISSKAGKVGLENYSFYVASKFALEGLTSCWSKEVIGRDIMVNSLSPGMVDTKSFPKAPGKEGVRTAESIKDCLLFALTCNDIRYTGHYIHADEYDMVQNSGLPPKRAWKPIDEEPFAVEQKYI